ncbi:unnamed protein product [Hydatigera taeniaeformis]|uniref:Uncharacterized protein n=1 Tax=Hydatigena taeniaeformis TaxID=6205 RepID=A0A3P7FJE3_HYDTA|nr:unnamed protein product [Hydatigera taeniaeformis]
MEDFRGSGGPPEVKIKPPLPSSSSTSTSVQSVEAGLCVEGLLGTDSNGSRTFRLYPSLDYY